jgi:hypothetical protein
MCVHRGPSHGKGLGWPDQSKGVQRTFNGTEIEALYFQFQLHAGAPKLPTLCTLCVGGSGHCASSSIACTRHPHIFIG